MRKLHIIIVLYVILTCSSISFATENIANITGDELPEIDGTFAITMDVETKEIIFAKNIDDRAFPASTTKIMTALIFAENKEKTDLLRYTENALEQPSYSLHKDYGPISLGYEMTGDMVMKSLLIYSANDVAAMVEDNLRQEGMNLMEVINDRILSLGLKNSYFVSPNGVHDETHYTTAYDLSIMAIESFSNPWVQEVLNMDEVMIEIESGILPVKNSKQKLTNIGSIYSKTGYTKKAGRCLVAIYERNGKKIVGVVLNAEYNFEDLLVFQDMDMIINWSFEQAEKVSYLDTLNLNLLMDVDYYPLKTFGDLTTQTIPLTYLDDFTYYPNLTNDAELKYEVKLFDVDVEKLSTDEPVGEIIITQRNFSHSIDIFSTLSIDDLYAQHDDLYKMIRIGITAGIVLISLIFMLMILKIKNGLRRQRKYFR